MLISLCIVLSALIILPVTIKCMIRLRLGIIGSLLIGLITAVILYPITLIASFSYLQLILLEIPLIMMVAIGVLLYKFYRDPERIPPSEPDIIVSPADGFVLYIKKIDSGKVPFSSKSGKTFPLEEFTRTDLLNSGLYLIGIMMTSLDVHVNRAPVKGNVVSLTYTPGKFLSLRNEQAVINNERLTTVIDQGAFRVGVVQIASRLVRRIESYLKEGQLVELGQRLGIIKFGSQVDLVIPSIQNLRIEVKPEDEVKAGVSVLARY